jgi:hypothetical protein
MLPSLGSLLFSGSSKAGKKELSFIFINLYHKLEITVNCRNRTGFFITD